MRIIQNLKVLVILLLVGALCQFFDGHKPSSTQRDPASLSGAQAPLVLQDYYLGRIQPIFAARCINCHGCAASPCELKLDSFEGLDRGATKVVAYGANLRALPPFRLKDAHTREEWDAKGFFSVLSRNGSPQARLHDSLLYRFVEQGESQNPMGFDLSNLGPMLKRESPSQGNTCVAENREFEELIRRFPHAGMPYALPALSAEEFSTLKAWIEAGAPGPSSEAQVALEYRTPSEESVIASWEDFFNPGSQVSEMRRAQAALVSRYIYEHVFMAHISIAGVPGKLFELVRSSTAYPEPVQEIVTAQPMDPPPHGETVYYRLKPYTELIAQKSHLVWKLDAYKRSRLENIFYGVNWGNAPILAASYSTQNPFINFARIPAVSRSRFMFEDSTLMVNAMIRGPVCVGNTATYAIRDQFWVFFAKPESDPTVLDPTLGYRGAELEYLMDKSPLGKQNYRKHYEQTVRRLKPQGYALADIWDGERQNPNAVLTVLRHETNATVLRGAWGPPPRTSWFITYSSFERLYYDLVAQYMYWKGAGHALETWTFMSTLREGFEDEFLSLMPIESRARLRSEWNQGLGAVALNALPADNLSRDRKTSIENIDKLNPYPSLLQKLRDHVGEKIMAVDSINQSWNASAGAIPAQIASVQDWEASLSSISASSEGTFSRFLPEDIHLLLRDGSRVQAYSLLVNRWYKFNNLVLAQSNARDSRWDTFIALPGVVGDFPELFVDLSLDHAAEFLQELTRIGSKQDWQSFQMRWGVLRNSPQFWPFLEELQHWNMRHQGVEAGALDLNRYRGY